MTLLAALVALSPVALADPDCPSSSAQLAAHVAVTFEAFNDTDQVAYLAGRDRVFASLDCLDGRISSGLAADVHAVLALDAFIARRPDVAVAALRSYADLRPDAPLAARVMMPPALSALADEAESLPQSPEQALPGGVGFHIDGISVGSWRPERVAVVQAFATDASGRVWTDRIPLGGPVPVAPAWVEVVSSAADPQVQRGGRAWWWASGVGALASGGLWWGALREQAAFDDYASRERPLPPSLQQEVQSTADRANRLGAAAQVSSALTVGLSTVALIVAF